MAQPLESRVKRLYALTIQDIIAQKADESAVNSDSSAF